MINENNPLIYLIYIGRENRKDRKLIREKSIIYGTKEEIDFDLSCSDSYLIEDKNSFFKEYENYTDFCNPPWLIIETYGPSEEWNIDVCDYLKRIDGYFHNDYTQQLNSNSFKMFEYIRERLK